MPSNAGTILKEGVNTILSYMLLNITTFNEIKLVVVSLFYLNLKIPFHLTSKFLYAYWNYYLVGISCDNLSNLGLGTYFCVPLIGNVLSSDKKKFLWSSC